MEIVLAKPNYRFAKRQRELVKKARQLEKQQRHASRVAAAPLEPPGTSLADVEPLKPSQP